MDGTPVSTDVQFIVSGPSGVGKDTVLREVYRITGFKRCRSVTTRPARAGDEGKYHYATDAAEVMDMVAAGKLLEYAEYNGHLYGSFKPGPGEILEIDLQGARKAMQQLPNAILIFLMPPGPTMPLQLQVLEERMTDRDGRVDEGRIIEARRELAEGPDLATFVVVNEDVEKAASEIAGLICV